MSDYGTVVLLQAYLPQVVDETTLASILTRASRAIDRVCELGDNFFAVAETDASEKVFIGIGIQMLSLVPFVAGSLATTGAVAIENLTDTIEYRLRDNRYLLRTTSDALWNWGEPKDYDFSRRNARSKPVWPDDKRVTVTARWGWAATPEDVINATLEIAGVMYRQNPERQISLDTGDTQINEAAIPLRARLIKSAYAIWKDNDAE